MSFTLQICLFYFPYFPNVLVISFHNYYIQNHKNIQKLNPSLLIIDKFSSTTKYHVFVPLGRFQLELIYLYFPPSFHLTVGYFCTVGLSLLTPTGNCPSQETEVTSTPTRPVENVVRSTKGLQDKNNLLLGLRRVENKGKLIVVRRHCSRGQ